MVDFRYKFNIKKRYIKYWFKLIKIPENLSLDTCYKMQESFDKTYQVTDLKQLLLSNGFGHVWISQGVGDKGLFKNY